VKLMVSGKKAGKLLRSDPCESFYQINDIFLVGLIQPFPSILFCLSVCLSVCLSYLPYLPYLPSLKNDESPSCYFSAHRQLISYSPKTPRIPIVKFETIVDKRKAAWPARIFKAVIPSVLRILAYFSFHAVAKYF